MVYSKKHKFIFIHPIKTGGESILSYFNIDKKHFTVQEVFNMREIPHDAEKPGWLRWSRGRKKWFDRYAEELKSKWNTYFKFAFVRNPWDRCVSEYHYNIKKDDITREKDFKSYILNVRDTDTVWKLPYYEWLQDGNGVIDIDYIGRFENLQGDFDIVCDKIGIPRGQLPHKNKSKHKHYTEYYDDETRQIVAEKYAKDIEYFGYEF